MSLEAWGDGGDGPWLSGDGARGAVEGVDAEASKGGA